uniref:Tyrosine-protein phosphatase non-receptor type 23 n=1 Tax=Gopherus agassizii TaxID=38772 RepID=A0A452J2S0_9SAUR
STGEAMHPLLWINRDGHCKAPFSVTTQDCLRACFWHTAPFSLLLQNAVSVPRDFEGCSILRKYFGQLHYLQSRVPMGSEHEAAVPVTWTEIFSGKAVTHEDIKYEQACILYNLGALHSMLGAMDKRVSEEGMKVSCTHFQCAAGAFTYLRDHFPHSYSVDMSHQILNLNINLMLGQAQECLLEKSMLDNRKSFLVARISAQVVDYYKEACRALENSDTASLLGKIQKDWKKLVQMKIYYFAAIAHVSGKNEVVYFQSALDKLNEAIKLAKVTGSPFPPRIYTSIVCRYNSAKKDNDFIYHEAVPALDTLQSVKGATLVKALPVNPTDPAVTGPDIFAKLVPMAAHEASSLYSEEKAKLLREVMAKIEAKNEVLDQFMDSMQLDPETVDNLDMYNHIPPILMEKCAALSVRPDTVKNLVQSMQVLSGVFTDVEASLKEIRDLLDDDELQDQKLQELLGKPGSPPSSSPGLAEVSKEWAKYMEVHEKASFTNTELHKAMNLHISNLRLLSGPLEQVRAALPVPALMEDDKQVLQNLKRILSKVQEMKDQRMSLEQQLREMIQKDDITTSLVTTDRSEMRKLFEEQLKKYDQIKVYLEQNLAAQENVLKALTDANVKYAAVRKVLAEVEHKWNTTLQTLVASYEAYEDLMKKAQEGKDFYADLESKAAKLLEKARAACQASEASRQQVLEREMKKKPPPRPTAPKPLGSLSLADLPEELRSLPPDVLAAHLTRLPADALAAFSINPAFSSGAPGSPLQGPFPPQTYSGPPVLPSQVMQPHRPPSSAPSPSPQLYPAGTLQRGPGHPSPAMAPPQPPRFSGQAPGGSNGPPHPLGVRPATTTVDSIQAPISSYTAPRAMGGHMPPRLTSQPPGLPPQGSFLGPPAQFPYAQGGVQPFGQQPPFPAGPPAPSFPQQQYPPQAQLQPLPVYQPQAQFPGQHSGLAHVSPSHGQIHAQLRTQLYPLPSQDSAPHSFPAAMPCGPLPLAQSLSGTMVAPAQQLHPHRSLAGLQPMPAGSSAQVVSAMPYCPAPSACHPGPPTNQLPPGSAMPLAGPQPPASSQSGPHHVPPSPSPALSQMPGSVIVPGPAIPSPRPPPSLTPGTAPPAQSPAELQFHRQSSSTDDLLSSSPESQHGGSKTAVNQPLLQPTKADAKEGQKPKAVQLIENDPYEKPEHIMRLLSELDRFRGVVASLEKPIPRSVPELDGIWKELQDAQERDARQLSIAIARCYSMKNRHQDIMPYDKNRIVLQSGKDDYINASKIEDLSSYCPTIIATQAPLVGTASDFWLMIYEQKVSLIVMLVSEQEIEKQKVVRYFPQERGQPMVQGPITLLLTSLKVAPTHVERMITLQFRDQSLKRTVIHLQFTAWPELGLPDSKGNLLRFIQEVHGHYLHQRPLHTPIVVHCSSGVGRTGAFCLMYAAMQEVEAGNSIPDLAQLVKRMRQQRKHMLLEKLHLKFCYEAVLKHAEQVLQRHGVTTPASSKPPSSAAQKLYLHQDPQDLVLGGDMPISSIQATIAKLSIKPPGGGAVPAAPASVAQPSLTEHVPPTSAELPPISTMPVLLPEAESSNHVEERPSREPSATSLAPSSSSLELLASLTPEAFSLDSSLRGKPRMNKQSFLQPQNGEGLRGPRPSDDPLSMLDPLWTLNKT